MSIVTVSFWAIFSSNLQQQWNLHVCSSSKAKLWGLWAGSPVCCWGWKHGCLLERGKVFAGACTSLCLWTYHTVYLHWLCYCHLFPLDHWLLTKPVSFHPENCKRYLVHSKIYVALGWQFIVKSTIIRLNKMLFIREHHFPEWHWVSKGLSKKIQIKVRIHN